MAPEQRFLKPYAPHKAVHSKAFHWDEVPNGKIHQLFKIPQTPDFPSISEFGHTTCRRKNESMTNIETKKIYNVFIDL
jgi:hypothetical protein